MSSCGGYPLGAEYDRNAPWKEKEPEKVSKDVCVSMCVHKIVTVEVPENYDNTDLYDAVQEAIWKDISYLRDEGYIEDEFEVDEE